ncbi:MAG: MFS transporter [Myxococcota bacterium]
MASSPRQRLFTAPLAFTFAACFASNLSFHVFTYLPGYLQGLGATEATIGVLAAVAHAIALASRPVLAPAMDRQGRRAVIRVGGVIHVIAAALYLTVQDLGPWIYVVRGLHGLGIALLFSAYFTVAADLVPAERRTEGLSLFGVSGILPVGLAPWLGDRILAVADYDALFATSAGLAAVGALFALGIPETKPGSAGAGRPSMLRTLRRRELVPLWLVGVIFASGLTAYFTFLKTYVGALGLGSLGSFFLPYALTAVGMRLVLGWVPDRVGPRRALFPSMAVFLIGMLVLAAASSTTSLALAGVLCGIGHGYTFPILSALIVTRAPAEERGAAVTLFTALFDAGPLISAPVLGSLADGFGHGTMYAAMAVVGALGVLAFALLDTQERRVAPAVLRPAPREG